MCTILWVTVLELEMGTNLRKRRTISGMPYILAPAKRFPSRTLFASLFVCWLKIYDRETWRLVCVYLELPFHKTNINGSKSLGIHAGCTSPRSWNGSLIAKKMQLCPIKYFICHLKPFHSKKSAAASFSKTLHLMRHIQISFNCTASMEYCKALL